MNQDAIETKATTAIKDLIDARIAGASAGGPIMSSADDTARLIEKLDDLLTHLKRPTVSAHDTLWTHQDIANWLQLALYTVDTCVITLPEFPRPLQPCQTGQRASKRWFAGEVIQWARKNRHHLPVPRAKRKPQSSRPATSEAVAL